MQILSMIVSKSFDLFGYMSIRLVTKILQNLWMISYRLGWFRQHIARLMLYLSQKRAEILAYKQRKVAFESEIETEKDMI